MTDSTTRRRVIVVSNDDDVGTKQRLLSQRQPLPPQRQPPGQDDSEDTFLCVVITVAVLILVARFVHLFGDRMPWMDSIVGGAGCCAPPLPPLLADCHDLTSRCASPISQTSSCGTRARSRPRCAARMAA
jgi:hypothetical protein